MSDEHAEQPREGGRKRSQRRTGRRQQRSDARRRDTRLDRIALVGMTVLALLGPMLFGGALPWTTGVLAALAAATLLLCGFSSTTTADERAPTLFVVVIGLVLWTGLQATPLPIALVRWAAPSSADDAERSAALVGEGAPAYVALSRAPGATLGEVLKGFAAASALVAAYVLARRGHRIWVLSACGAAGALTAVVALGHLLAGAHTVFGLYAPVHASAEVLGPLLNPNHLGGVMAFAATLATGLAMTASDRRLRIVWILCAITCAAVCAIARSRGAFGALVLGLMLLGGWSLARARRSRTHDASRQWAALAGTGVAAASLSAAAYMGWSELWPEFVAPGATSKLDLAARGLVLVERSPWTGVGRGAFGEVFVRVFGDTSRVTHPENIVVQWLSEWGIPAGLVALGAFAAALVAAATRMRTPARAGALFGVAAIAAQNLVDFSLEMSGVLTLVAIAFGAALAPRTETPGPLRGVPLRQLALVAGVVCLVGTAALAPLVERWSVPALETELRAGLTRVDRTAFRATLAVAVKAHPSEPTFPLLAAADAIQRRTADAPAWLNRAMTLAPRWGASHLLAAAWLRSRDRQAQAWLEMREAARLTPERTAAAVCEMRGLDGDLSGFEASIPRRAAERTPYLRALATCLPLLSAEALRVDSLLAALHIDQSLTRGRAARRSLARGDATAAMRALERVRPSARSLEERELLAEALMRLERPRDALREINAGLAASGKQPRLLERKARAQAALHDAAAVRATIEELRYEGGGDSLALGAAERLLGDLELQLGNPARAIAAYDLAHTYTGDDGVLASLAVAAERLGNRRRAIAAWDRLCTTVGPASDACAQHDRLQALERPGDLPQPTAARGASPAQEP